MAVKCPPIAIAVCSLLLVGLGARPSAAQEAAPSRTYSFDEARATVSATTSIRGMLNGRTHSGYLLDMHVTELAAGQAPHEPHQHVHEEMLLVIEGDIEITIAGKTSRLGPRSAAYIASNDLHGWRNVGTTPARYFVVALGDDSVPAASTVPASGAGVAK